jgi:hypothetical protein
MCIDIDDKYNESLTFKNIPDFGRLRSGGLWFKASPGQ